MQHKVITTDDGSHTIYVPELNEHYHSTRGAVQESNHIFIDKGFRFYLERLISQSATYKDRQINILEIGFGTGLNALLTLLEAEKSSINVNYHSVELYPVSIEEAEKLNYIGLVNKSEQNQQQVQDQQLEINKVLFLELHISPWEKAVDITPGFTLLKHKFDFSQPEKFITNRLYNIIYFDAFAPEKQPEMWTQEIFNKIFSLCSEGAVFTTYCAKGSVRRMLQSAGFKMERLPGPPGKREILRGTII